MKEAVYHNP